MATIVTRETTQTDGTSPKGSPLTNAEVDTNFINLNDNKVEVSGAIIFQAKAGEALSKGDVVYVSGVSGNEPVVSKADADDASKMPAYGLAEADANLNAAVNVVTFGTLYDLDTSSFSAGDTVYVSTTAGAITTTAPTGESSLLQNIGTVIRSHASAGSIKVGGAGRTNATPNLNDGNVFIGNASNQAVARALTGDDISGGTITSFTSTGIDDNATSTAITIDSSENVGIGTSSPSELLDVGDHTAVGNRNIRISQRTGTSGLTYGGLEFYMDNTAGTEGVNAAIKYATGALRNDGELTFHTGASGSISERMRINHDGKVGINEINPQTELHLTKDTAPIVRFERDDTTIASGNGLGQIQFAHKEVGNEGVAATLRVEAGNASGSGMFVFQTGLADTVNDCMYVNHFGLVTIDPSGGGDQITHELSVRNNGSPRLTIDHLNGTGSALSSALLFRYSATNAGWIGYLGDQNLIINNDLAAGDIIYETPTEHSFTIGGTEELRITNTETSVFGTSGDIFTLVDTNLTASASNIGNVRIAFDDSAGTRVAYIGTVNNENFFVNNQYGSVKLTYAGSTKITTINEGINVTGSICIGSSSSHAGAGVVINDTPPTAFGSPMLQVGQETFTASGYYSIGLGFTNGTYTEPPAEIAAVSTSSSGGTTADIVFGTRSVTTNTAVTERVRILSTGGITFNGDTATANALDDYEEGTWTPSPNYGTVSGVDCIYTKIGNTVHVSGALAGFSDYTTTEDIIISGLPFTSSVSSTVAGAVMYRDVNVSTLTDLTAYLGSNSSTLRFYISKNNGGNWAILQYNNFDSGLGDLYFSLTYRV